MFGEEERRSEHPFLTRGGQLTGLCDRGSCAFVYWRLSLPIPRSMGLSFSPPPLNPTNPFPVLLSFSLSLSLSCSRRPDRQALGKLAGILRKRKRALGRPCLLSKRESAARKSSLLLPRKLFYPPPAPSINAKRRREIMCRCVSEVVLNLNLRDFNLAIILRTLRCISSETRASSSGEGGSRGRYELYLREGVGFLAF